MGLFKGFLNTSITTLCVVQFAIGNRVTLIRVCLRGKTVHKRVKDFFTIIKWLIKFV